MGVVKLPTRLDRPQRLVERRGLKRLLGVCDVWSRNSRRRRSWIGATVPRRPVNLVGRMED